MDLGLQDRTYVITGGTSGLGRATAAALVADGANVVVSSRNADKVADAVRDLGSRAVGVTVDNGHPDAAEQLLQEALGRFGAVHGLLVSVGGPPAGAASTVGDQAWREAFESVFLGAVRLARTFGAHLAARGPDAGGAIGFVLSSSVRTPLPRLAISNGLRPGLAMFAKDLADELGPKGVRVVNLVPGRILTDRTIALEQGDADARARSEANIPLRRLGEPAEFGRVAAMMMSPAASYVTGSTVLIDGGMIRAL